MSSYYATGAAGSSAIDIDNISVRGFVAGICITPNQVTQNAEDIAIRKSQMLYNRVGVSIGQSQSRRVSFVDSDVLGALYAFDGISYGRQHGFSPLIVGGNIGWVKYIFNVQQSFGIPVKATDIHAETFASIGFIIVPLSLSIRSATPRPIPATSSEKKLSDNITRVARILSEVGSFFFLMNSTVSRD